MKTNFRFTEFLRSYLTENAIIIMLPNSARTSMECEFSVKSLALRQKIHSAGKYTTDLLLMARFSEKINTRAPQRRLELPVTDNRAPPLESQLRESQKPKLNPKLRPPTLLIEPTAGDRFEQFFRMTMFDQTLNKSRRVTLAVREGRIHIQWNIWRLAQMISLD